DLEPVRLGRWPPVYLLLSIRNPEQPGSLPRRPAGVARAHHDYLGHYLGLDRLRRRTPQLLCRALVAGRRRGRLLRRRHLLSLRLVPGAGPHPHARLVPRRHSAVDGDRWPARGVAAAARRRQGICRLAMAVLRCEPALRGLWANRLRRAERPAAGR